MVRQPVQWGIGLISCWLGALAPALAAETGFQPEVQVRLPTRLDWQFAASGFGPDATKVPGSYESARQRYQLFVPPGYKSTQAWPLVVFISPGDDPLGWRSWQKVCEEGDLLFCAAYGAGNNCPPGQRTRIVLDMLDDVRRRYRIDPDQTYLAGFSGGGRLACSIAFALPEFFGGVIPVCGTNPLNRLDYLRHRAHDRLSVAFVTGANDFNRREHEDFLFPLFQDLGIRARLWVVPNLGHALPPGPTLRQVHAWLAEDLPRRRADARAYPWLAASSDNVTTDRQRAEGVLETAAGELRRPERVYRGVALLQGILARWSKTEAAEKARRLLAEIQDDPRRLALLEEQGGAEERRLLTAQAQAFERFGQARAAQQAWELLANSQPDTPEGKQAATAARRLAGLLARTPFLGLELEGDTTTVKALVPKEPADRAGLRRGDRLVKLANQKIGSLADLRRALRDHKPGDRLAAELQRDGQSLKVTVEVGTVPMEKE